MNEDTSVALVIPDSYSPVELKARIKDRGQEIAILQEFVQGVMVKDHDYGVIPGTQKPTLLKPGAEKLAELYGYAPTLKGCDETIDRDTGFYRVRVTVALVSKRTGTVVAEGTGEANTKEGRYRWRNAERTCPHCGTAAIIKGKEEYGGGWLCFAKKGGCGAKFDDTDKRITDQPIGRVENDDPWTLWNTVLKMGKKRALIDAVLSATRSSGLFTQDMEDLPGWVEGEVVDREQPANGNGSGKPQERPQWPPAQRAAPVTASTALKDRARAMATIEAIRQSFGREDFTLLLGNIGARWEETMLAGGKVDPRKITDDHAAAMLAFVTECERLGTATPPEQEAKQEALV